LPLGNTMFAFRERMSFSVLGFATMLEFPRGVDLAASSSKPLKDKIGG